MSDEGPRESLASEKFGLEDTLDRNNFSEILSDANLRDVCFSEDILLKFPYSGSPFSAGILLDDSVVADVVLDTVSSLTLLSLEALLSDFLSPDSFLVSDW
jgi:hypothetical protein